MRSPQSPLHTTPITLSRRGFLKKVFHTIRQAAKSDDSASDMLVMNIDMTMTAMTMATPTNTTTAVTIPPHTLIRYLPILSAHMSRLMQPEYIHRPTRVDIPCSNSLRLACSFYKEIRQVP